MTLLGLSLLPLVLGPLLVQCFTARPRALPGLDSFVFVSVIGIVFVHILPNAVTHGGLPALIAAIVGLTLPFLFERHHGGGVQRRHAVLSWFALFGLGIHGILDGLSLAAGDLHARNGEVLALGVLLHRLPEGMAIWCYARRHLGNSARVLAVMAVPVLASIVGFAVPHLHGAVLDGVTWDVLQALLFGVIAHVLLHEPLAADVSSTTGRWRGASLVGAILGLGLLALLGSSLPARASELQAGRITALRAFVALSLESAPPVLLGFAVAGLLHAFVPERIYRWIGRGRPVLQAIKGAAVGAPLSVCSCSILPIYRTLIASSVPMRSALAFLLTAPEVGAATIFLSYRLLGAEMTWFRLVSACILGVTVSLGATLRERRAPLTPEALLSPPRRWTPTLSVTARIRAGLAYGFGELVDHTAPWILAGLALAAILEPSVSPNLFQSLPLWAQVPVAAVIGIPLYVCAAGSTPLVALLLHKGLSAGAGIALLLSGPATNIATFGLLTRLHGKRLAVSVAVGVLMVSVISGAAYHLLRLSVPTVPLHEMAEEQHSLWDWAWLALAALVLLLSIARQGVRVFLKQLFAEGGHGAGRTEKGSVQWSRTMAAEPDNNSPSAYSPGFSERGRRHCSTGY